MFNEPATLNEAGMADVSTGFQRVALLVLPKWRLIGLLAVVGFIAGALLAVTRERNYTAVTSFIPHHQSKSVLPAFAEGFDLGIGSGDATRTPEFYAELVTSRRLLERAVQHPYRVSETGPDTAFLITSLSEFDKIRNPRAKIRPAAEWLGARTSTAIRPRTGVVTLSVTTASPSLSTAVAARLLQLISEFDQSTRQSAARAEREFSEERLEAVRQSLYQTEDRLARFLDQNRAISGSPRLRTEEERLSREVARQQQVYITVAQALEKAKIEEVRAQPVLTVIDPPVPPMRGNARGTVGKALTGGFLGLLLGILVVLATELRRRLKGQWNAIAK